MNIKAEIHFNANVNAEFIKSLNQGTVFITLLRTEFAFHYLRIMMQRMLDKEINFQALFSNYHCQWRIEFYQLI